MEDIHVFYPIVSTGLPLSIPYLQLKQKENPCTPRRRQGFHPCSCITSMPISRRRATSEALVPASVTTRAT